MTSCLKDCSTGDCSTGERFSRRLLMTMELRPDENEIKPFMEEEKQRREMEEKQRRLEEVTLCWDILFERLFHRRVIKEQKQRRNGKKPYKGLNFKPVLLAVLLFSLVMLAHGLEDDKHSFCRLHSDTSQLDFRLECHFQEDLRKGMHTFQVYHIKQEGSPDVVAEGRWTEGDHTVYTADGYEHDGIEINKVFIKIQKRAVQGGRIYTCILPPVTLADVKTCHVPGEYISHVDMALHNSSSSKEGSSLSSSVLVTPTVSMSSAKLPVAQDMMQLLIIAVINYSFVKSYF